MLCPLCNAPLGPAFEVVRALNARNSDPSTSKLAALQNEPRREGQKGRAVAAIRGSGMRGLTAHEVERQTGVKGIWRRISELKQGGHIVAVGTRVDPETGADCDVFRATGMDSSWQLPGV
jgi:hypothetical protein